MAQRRHRLPVSTRRRMPAGHLKPGDCSSKARVARLRGAVVGVGLHDGGADRAGLLLAARQGQLGDCCLRGLHQFLASRVRYLLPMAVLQRAFQRVQQVEAGPEARATHAHVGVDGPGGLKVRPRVQADLAQPGRGLRADVAHLFLAHRSESMYVAAIRSSPAWSCSSKRPFRGLSISNTPTRLPSSSTNGTTSSEREAASQAMWPGNASTSSTRWVVRVLAAAPHTPRSSGIRTQAGWPWNGPTTSSVPSKK